MLVFAQGGPPQTPQQPPEEVWGVVWVWLQYALWITLAGSVVSVLILGAMMILDKNRGEPVSAVAPHVKFFQIALGVTVASGAATLAAYFV
jgi:hypothetical protein